MGGCENYGPLLGPLNNRCRIILRAPKGIGTMGTYILGIEAYVRYLHGNSRPVIVCLPQ